MQPPNPIPPDSAQTARAHAFKTHVEPDLVKDWAALGEVRPAFGAHRRVSAEETVLDEILSEDLESAVNSLAPRFRTVLLLVDVDRLTYAEAAEALGVPVGTIMSRLSRARDRVRLHLRGHTIAHGRTS